MVVEDIGNQHENVEFGLGIREELLGDEKGVRRSMSGMWELQSGWCTAGGVLFLLALAKFSIWRGDWALSYHSVGSRHSPDIS